MNNPLLQTLQVVFLLSRGPTSLKIISEQFDLGPATVKRYLADARLLGADIVSARVGGVFVYELRNWQAIKVLTLRWLELEQNRSLLMSKT